MLPVTYITLQLSIKMSLSGSLSWSCLHLHLIIKRLLLYLHILSFGTPSGVFTITCIISLSARGVYSIPTWTRDHFSWSCVKRWGVIKANHSSKKIKSHEMEFIFQSPWKGGNTCSGPHLDICRSLLGCCNGDGVSVMAFFFPGNATFLMTNKKPHSCRVKPLIRGHGMKKFPEGKSFI